MKTELLQHPSNEHIARPVERRIDDPEIPGLLFKRFGTQDERPDCIKIGTIDLLADHAEQPLRQRLLLRDAHDVLIRDGVHMADDALIIGRYDLTAVRKIHLIAVVFGRIVACRDDDARRSMEIPHGKGEHGRGAQALEEIGPDAVGCKNARRIAGKHIGTAAAVVSNDDTPLHPLGTEEGGKALARAADGVGVHAVAARSQDAAQAPRPEGEVAIEAVLDLLLVGKRPQFALGIFIKDGG